MKHHFRSYWTARGIMPRWALVLCYFLITFVFAYTAKTASDNSHRNARNIVALKHEETIRTDQVCQLFERARQENISRLVQTYSYLQGLTPAQRKTPLNRAVFAQLPQTEIAARRQVPKFCLAPGVGLPGNPQSPKRPKGL